MERTPEPDELMEAADQVEAYARADFAQANALFCERLEALAGTELSGRALDLGCGPADIPLRLARRHAALRFVALDGSAEMLRWAQRAVDVAELGARVSLVQASLSAAALDAASFDYVLSNSLLHHLAEPHALWSLVKRTVRSGGLVQLMDLMRPASADEAAAIVARYSGDEPEVLRRDFFASLCAAFTPDEVRAQLATAGLPWLAVEIISDRHMAISGRAP
jgi:ubiquinone/menaquinone biosynthesis C-methylase UbiE